LQISLRMLLLAEPVPSKDHLPRSLGSNKELVEVWLCK
jgi:hypothetical protein